MDLFSGYGVEAVAHNPTAKTQGSKLTVEDPTTLGETLYTCRVTPTGQVASNTDVDLDVYGTYLYSSNHVDNLKC